MEYPGGECESNIYTVFLMSNILYMFYCDKLEIKAHIQC